MAKKYFVNLDLNNNSLLNPVLNPLASAPANANPYYVYTSTATSDKGTIYTNVGTYATPVWKAIGAVQSVNGKTGVVVLDKTDIGLGNVDNTSDATKKSNFTGSIADGNTGFTTGDAVFDALALKLSLAGGTMSGNLAMGGNKITGLADGTNDGDAVTKKQLDAAKLGALKPSGSVAFANLPALSASVLNNIYNITDAFTTTSDFVEGAGVSYPAGTNVAIINTGTDANPVYKYDTYTGVIDLSPYLKKNGTVAMTGNLAMGSHKITGLSNGTAASDAAAYGQIPVAATSKPLMDGTAAVGSSAKWAKEDHVHPTDTSRAPLASPALTGTPTAPTAASGTNTTQIATTAFVDAAVKGTVTATTGTIGTSATMVTVNYTGTFVNAYAHQSGAIVVTDVTVNSNSVVFTVAAAPSAAITCVVVAAKAAS